MVRSEAILVLIFVTAGAAAADTGLPISLANGYELHVKEIVPSRNLPHVYHDQAMSSIPNIYPDSEIIAERRSGRLDQNPGSLYSLVCYKRTRKHSEVTISGVFTSTGKAWSFSATVAQRHYADTIAMILEALSQLP